jgi:hypothetical protein
MVEVLVELSLVADCVALLDDEEELPCPLDALELPPLDDCPEDRDDEPPLAEPPLVDPTEVTVAAGVALVGPETPVPVDVDPPALVPAEPPPPPEEVPEVGFG